MDNKKIFAFLFIGLFMISMISMVSAFEFDNFKEYDQATETIQTKNCALWVGGCLIEGDVLAEYTLTENTDQCMFDCYAEGTATLNGDQVLFQDVEFRNKKGDTKEINEFKWFIQVEDREDGQRDTYETVCNDVWSEGNQTMIEECNQVVNGTEGWETVTYDWQRYVGEELPSGSYTWRIEGRKNKLESVDWIVSSNGKKLDEWAWWNSSWDYKRTVTVTETSGSELTDYSTLINVTNDEVNGDFNSIRFLDTTGSTVYPHYNFKTGGGTGKAYADLTTAEKTDIYMDISLDENAGTVEDLSGNNYDGTVSGATYTASGHIASAYNFDGTNDRIAFTSRLPTNTGAVEVWVNPDYAPTDTSYRFLFASANTGDDIGRISFTRLDSKNIYEIQIYDNSGTACEEIGFPASLIPQGEWSSIGLSYTDNDVSLYVNGRLEAHSTNCDVSSTAPTGFFWMGGWGTGANYFDGQLDNFRVWNRTVDAEEFASNYNASWQNYYVKIPTLSASTTTDVDMYYGNSDASLTSDIKTAFLLGDDFNDGSVNTVLWDVVAETPTESGGFLRLDGTSAYEILASDEDFSQQRVMVTQTRVSATADYSTIDIGNHTSSGKLTGYTYEGNTGKTRGHSYRGSGSDWTGTEIESTVINTWKEFTTTLLNNLTHIVNVEGVDYSTLSTESQQASPITFGNWHGDAGTLDVNYVYLRNYASSDPTYSIGAEGDSSRPPTVTLNSPANDHDQISPSFDFNCTVSDDVSVVNVSLVVDDVIRETNTSGLDADYLFTYSVTSTGSHNWSCEAWDDVNTTTTASARNFTYSNDITITLNAPVDTLNSTDPSIQFNATPSDDTAVLNSSLYIDNILMQTDGSPTNNTLISFTETVADGDHNWTYQACDVYGCIQATPRDFTVDTTSPVITTAYNLIDLSTLSLPINSTWHYNATDTHLDTCYYNTTDDPTLQIVTCDSTITDLEWATGGSKTIQFCANDTFGWETCDTDTININYVTYDQNGNDQAVEGFDTAFNLTVDVTANSTLTTALLNINGSTYSPTTTVVAGGYFFEVILNVPDTWGNSTGISHDWYWNYTVDGMITNSNTSTENITVYELGIDNCSTYTDVILNMSLLDEETATAVNETAGADFEIDLTLTSKDNASVTLDYAKTWSGENNPLVCIPANFLNDTEWQIDFTIGFDSTDHVWEFAYLDNGTLDQSKVFDTLTSTPINFYDLLTDDSTSFLFNYFDADGLNVEDSIVHVYRKYIGSGVFLEVERAKADDSGDTLVHLVEEDVIYYFMISKNGQILHTSSTYTALCQSTPCTIQVEASSDSAVFPTDWDLLDNGAYTIQSDASTRMVNLTWGATEFKDIDLTVFKYNSDGSYSAIDTETGSGLSGEILIYVPQSAGNVSFFASVNESDEFLRSQWVDFGEKSSDRFGVTLSLFLAGIMILTLGLMAVTEGAGTLVFVILGVIIAGALGLISTDLSSGISIVLYLVLAGGMLLWKLTRGRS